MKTEEEIKENLRKLLEQHETCELGTFKKLVHQRAVTLAWVLDNPKAKDVVFTEDTKMIFECLY